MCYEAVADLRAAAALSAPEVSGLRAAGLRSLPATHGLRKLAGWARRSWRPVVRVHALRALVRSPAALAHLSQKAQEMLFAVFRTVNSSNRSSCAAFFGPLLLAEDPWILDAPADPVTEEDAKSATEAFTRLYEARHQFLGNIAPGSAAFAANPDLLHRESEALRRHLGQSVPSAPLPARGALLKQSAPKARRLLPEPEPSNSAPMRVVVRSQPVLLHPPEDVDPTVVVLEERVTELSKEVTNLRERMQRNEEHAKYQQSLIDFMAKMMFDDMRSTHMHRNVVSRSRAAGPMDVESLPPPLPATTTNVRSANVDQGTDDIRMRGDSLTNAGGYNNEEHQARLGRFRDFLEASPWLSVNANGSSDSGDSVRRPYEGGSRSKGSVKVWLNGRWEERE